MSAFGHHSFIFFLFNRCVKQSKPRLLDFSAESWSRVIAITAAGTLFCIIVAFGFDSFDIAKREWRWGQSPMNNLWIPLLLAPPFFFVLLSKMRELAIAHKEMKILASTDGLTSLLNRRAFTEVILQHIENRSGKNKERKSALLILDVDHFKAVNDNFGHQTGDDALRVIAQTISNNVGPEHVVARIGGEEFGVFIKDTSAQEVEAVAEGLRKSIHNTSFTVGGVSHRLSVSIGGFAFGTDCDFDKLYNIADQRLYDAKRAGRDRVALEFA